MYRVWLEMLCLLISRVLFLFSYLFFTTLHLLLLPNPSNKPLLLSDKVSASRSIAFADTQKRLHKRRNPYPHFCSSLLFNTASSL